MIGLQAGSVVPIHDSSGVKRWGLRVADDFDIVLDRYNSSGELQESVLTIDGATGAISGLDLAAGEIATADIADSAVTPVKIGASAITGTADAVIAILATTTHISLNSTTGAKSITTTSSAPGQTITIVADVCTGGSYTLAVTGGTLTFNSAGEGAIIKRVGSAWQVFSLCATTSTAANVATIV